MIRFDATAAEFDLVHAIVVRAEKLAAEHDVKVDRLLMTMDIVATHLNGCPLRLEELSKADDFNLAHDVFGIRGHLNRDTGQLSDCFLPRFAAPERVAA